MQLSHMQPAPAALCTECPFNHIILKRHTSSSRLVMSMPRSLGSIIAGLGSQCACEECHLVHLNKAGIIKVVL